MADGIPPRDPGAGETTPPPREPPPLDAIRVKGQGAKGLNKPAVLAAAGVGVAVVLVLASGAFSDDPARKPAETKPMMSDPARPEMAKGAIRALPGDYSQVETIKPESSFQLAQAPELGPPLPGDIAAFAQPRPELRSYASPGSSGWAEPQSYVGATPEDPLEQEGLDADRSGIFFALREQPASGSVVGRQVTTTSSSPLTLISPVPAPVPANDQAPEQPAGALFPRAVIPASLVTAVNSESPGPVIAQVTQAVYDSPTGRSLLIPQGARLIGDYRSSSRYGQSRIAITWSRLIMPDGREIVLAEAAVEPSGSAGVPGEVDNHWGDVFGAAALGTLINVGVATTEEPQIGLGGLGMVTRDPMDVAVADGVQRTASNVSNRVVDRGLAIPPTIRVPAGAKLSVIVTRRTVL